MQDYEAIVIGGGPAGSSAAAVLGQHGHRVLLLEQEAFPRYRIGESLLPYCYFPLERIGMIESMKDSRFVKKYSVQFVTTDGKVSSPFYFFQHFDHEASTTWQVVRSEFDSMLLENATEKGAEVRQGVTVTDFLREDGRVVGVRAVDGEGNQAEFRAAVTIDATGRQALALSKNGWRKWDPQLNKVAIWTYFEGGVRDPGLDEGSTTVAYLPEKGWFWYIPLPDNMVSVGIVGESSYLFRDTKDLGEVFCGEIGNNQWIKEHLAPAKQTGEYYVTKEFSYRSEYCAEDGLVLIGDAFAFLDPVFSSGVYLALRSGELAADAIHVALETGEVSAESFIGYSEQVCREIEAMRKLVYAFYDTAFSFGKLIKKNPEVRGDLTDCLIGNLDRDFSRLFGAVGELIELPPELEHGKPTAAVG
jgi:flavin-dependent dehydrogenase